jgi:hypothetical protein
MKPTSSQSRGAEDRKASTINGEFVSVVEALKLVSPFKGKKHEVLSFIGNADTAFAVINANQTDVLYRFVLTRISGEPHTAKELKEFLKNSYIEKRNLDFHASQLFRARQGKDEVTEWIKIILTLGSQFCEAALLNCSEGARKSILDLSDCLRNICLIQGLASDQTETTV